MRDTMPNDTDLDALVPHRLEHAYRSDPAAFKAWLDVALPQRPESVLLQAWQVRLAYREEAASTGNNTLLYTILIATVAWAIAKLPDYVTVDDEWFYPRFLPFLVLGGLVLYFLVNQAAPRKLLFQGLGALAVLLAVLLLLPDNTASDSITMALIHMPFVLLSLLGYVYGGGQWRHIGRRIGYIRFGGEMLIFVALILAGGGVLTALTLGLFGLIGIRLEEWFFEYVVLWGAMSAPLVATWVWDQVMNRESKLAPVIANVFSPLFLLMTVAYLLALLSEQRSPFNDREFLIVFNALLVTVWAITVFSVTGRGEKPSRLLDLTNLSLVAVTLVIDAVALTAILYRTFEFGITPNRFAVTGANLLIFVHLVWIFVEYVKALRGAGSAEVIRTTIARYLPVYTGWSLFVVIVLPLVFRFA